MFRPSQLSVMLLVFAELIVASASSLTSPSAAAAGGGGGVDFAVPGILSS